MARCETLQDSACLSSQGETAEVEHRDGGIVGLQKQSVRDAAPATVTVISVPGSSLRTRDQPSSSAAVTRCPAAPRGTAARRALSRYRSMNRPRRPVNPFLRGPRSHSQRRNQDQREQSFSLHHDLHRCMRKCEGKELRS